MLNSNKLYVGSFKGQNLKKGNFMPCDWQYWKDMNLVFFVFAIYIWKTTALNTLGALSFKRGFFKLKELRN